MNKATEFVSEHTSPTKPYGLRVKDNEIFTILDANGVLCHCNAKGPVKVKPDCVKDPRKDVGTYRVFVPKGASGTGGKMVLEGRFYGESSLLIGAPFEYCSEKYLSIGPFKSREHAENFREYFKTKFFRFMLRLRTMTQNMKSDSFAWVPWLDFSKTWTDEKLFKHFDLTQDEIAHIKHEIGDMPK